MTAIDHCRICDPTTGVLGGLLAAVHDRIMFTKGSPAGRRAYWVSISMVESVIVGELDDKAVKSSRKIQTGNRMLDKDHTIPHGPQNAAPPTLVAVLSAMTGPGGVDELCAGRAVTWGDVLDHSVTVRR